MRMLHFKIFLKFCVTAEKWIKTDRQNFVINIDPFFCKDIAIRKKHLRDCGKL